MASVGHGCADTRKAEYICLVIGSIPELDAPKSGAGLVVGVLNLGYKEPEAYRRRRTECSSSCFLGGRLFRTGRGCR